MKVKYFLGIAFVSLMIVLTIEFSHYLSLGYIKSQYQILMSYIELHKLTAMLIYFVVYILLTTFSIPGSVVITLLGAALFGFWISLLLASFASTIGATLAFLSSRYILRQWAQQKFKHKFATINQGIEKDGAFYLFSLRLIPIFPFFLINLLMGLTSISVKKYYITSQLGMLPGTIVFLNAGTQLANINSLSGIMSPAVLMSFAALGLFPILVKRILNYFISKKRVNNKTSI